MISARYPRQAQLFNDLRTLVEGAVLPDYIPQTPIIDTDSIIRAQGSCFAGNIARALVNRGLAVRHMDIQEVVNSPHANKIVYEHLLDPTRPYAFPQHQKLFPPALIEKARNVISTENIFILTLGLAATWFPKGGTVPILEPDVQNLDAFEFRFEGVDENLGYIRKIVDAIRVLNPTIAVVLTVSPVPLNGVFDGRKSAVVGDFISKATLRLALERYLAERPANVHYWPAFEIVRWLGAHLPPVFGSDDGNARHINQAMIDLIIDLFLTYFATPAVRALTPSSSQPA